MILRAREWLDQWQLNPKAVPMLLIMLAAGGGAAILAAFDLRTAPASYLLAAFGATCIVMSLWGSQRLSDDDRNGIKFAMRIMGTSGTTMWLEPMLSNSPVHWVYQLSLWTVIYMLLEPVVDLMEAGVRHLRRSLQTLSTVRRGP